MRGILTGVSTSCVCLCLSRTHTHILSTPLASHSGHRDWTTKWSFSRRWGVRGLMSQRRQSRKKKTFHKVFPACSRSNWSQSLQQERCVLFGQPHTHTHTHTHTLPTLLFNLQIAIGDRVSRHLLDSTQILLLGKHPRVTSVLSVQFCCRSHQCASWRSVCCECR